MCRAGQTPAAAAGAYVTSDCRELPAGVGGRLPARPAGSSARFPALGAGPGWGPRSGRGEGAGPRWRGGARPARAPHFGANCSGPGAGFVTSRRRMRCAAAAVGWRGAGPAPAPGLRQHGGGVGR